MIPSHFPRLMTTVIILISSVVLLPVAALLFISFGDSQGLWEHLFQNVMLKYVTTTLTLMIGVLALSLLFGLSTAWVITSYNFRFKKYLDLILILHRKILVL